VFWTLRALIKGEEIDEASLADTGLSLQQITDLANRMMRCRFGVLFFGQGLTQSRGKHMNTTAAFLLVRDLNSITKFALIPMRGHGNVTGVDNVLAWQTGYPFGVNFSRGYPRFNPGEFTMVDVFSRREVDATLVVAADPIASLPEPVRRRLAEVPIVALDTHESETTRVARVAFITATAGIGVQGTAYRMDNIALYMPRVLPSSYPSDEEVLGRLLTRVKELKPC
jgi:formylmethanofuran dehydrogenase subunit B